jgi:hypothetical protein
MAGYDRIMDDVQSTDGDLVLVPFCFTTNGASAPTLVFGDQVTSRLVTRTSAGLYTFTLYNIPYAVVGGGVTCTSGATEDIVPHLDATAGATTGIITVRTMTATTATDPISGAVVYGHLLCARNDRRAGA